MRAEAILHRGLTEAQEAPREVNALARAAAPSLRHFDADEFVRFAEAHFWGPRKSSPDWAPFEFTQWQVEEARKLILLDAAGQLASVLWIISWPRRHGKTQFQAMYLLTRCALYPNQTITVEANSEDQAQETVFRWCADIVERSVTAFKTAEGARRYTLHLQGEWALRAKAESGEPGGTLDVQIVEGEIRFGNGSTITLVTTGKASAFGRKLSVYSKTELHASPQEATFHAGSGSTADSWCGLTIVDSTQGQEGELLDKMTQDGKLAAATNGKEGDPACAVSHVHYHDIVHACEGNLAPWISAEWLRSMARRMPAPDFRRNHLNLATSGGATVFPAELLAKACETVWSPDLCAETRAGWAGDFTSRKAFRAMRRDFRGHGLRVGLGLDRSMGVVRGDRTIVTVSAMGVDPDRHGKIEREYDDEGVEIGERETDARVVLVLAVVCIPRGAGGVIRRLVRFVERLYGEPVMRLEQYQAKDLQEWAEGQGYEAEARAMTAQAKATHVQRMCELLAEERIALPAHAKEQKGWSGLLYAELSRYQEIESKGALPSYEGPRGTATLELDSSGMRPHKVKDDAAESMFWSIDAVLSLDPDDDGGLSL